MSLIWIDNPRNTHHDDNHELQTNYRNNVFQPN